MGPERRADDQLRPVRTRHAWLAGPDVPTPTPQQVLIVHWRRDTGGWSALVVHVVDGDGDAVVVHRWVPASSLAPAVVDPTRPRVPPRTPTPDPRPRASTPCVRGQDRNGYPFCTAHIRPWGQCGAPIPPGRV